MNSFNAYYKDQAPVDLSTAPPSSNISNIGRANRSSISNVTNTSNSQYSSSNFFNNNSLNIETGTNPSTYWNQSTQNGINVGPNTSASNNNQLQNDVEYYRNIIRIKENLISQLELEINRLQRINQASSTIHDSFIPSNYVQVFDKLATKLSKTQEELRETKLRYEALVASILSNPSNSITKNGRFDEFETFEKILTKLKNLEKENLELLKVSSFHKVKQFQIDLNFKSFKIDQLTEENERLRKENEELKKQSGK